VLFRSNSFGIFWLMCLNIRTHSAHLQQAKKERKRVSEK